MPHMPITHDHQHLKSGRVTTLSSWWLTYPSEKYESVGMFIPNLWRVIQAMFQTTNQLFIEDPKIHQTGKNLGTWALPQADGHSQPEDALWQLPMELQYATSRLCKNRCKMLQNDKAVSCYNWKECLLLVAWLLGCLHPQTSWLIIGAQGGFRDSGNLPERLHFRYCRLL